MRLHIDEATKIIHLRLDDREVASCEEVRPGVRIEYDASGELVGVEIDRTATSDALNGRADSEVRQEQSELRALMEAAHEEARRAGRLLTTEEEFDREIATLWPDPYDDSDNDNA
jgi:uncharacterized protein YuzE